MLFFSGLIYTQINPESDTIVINSINIKTETGDLPAENVSFKEAANWAYNTRLTLLPDSPPVVDNEAFFIAEK